MLNIKQRKAKGKINHPNFQLKPTPRVGKCVFHGDKSCDKTRASQTQKKKNEKSKKKR